MDVSPPLLRCVCVCECFVLRVLRVLERRIDLLREAPECTMGITGHVWEWLHRQTSNSLLNTGAGVQHRLAQTHAATTESVAWNGRRRRRMTESLPPPKRPTVVAMWKCPKTCAAWRYHWRPSRNLNFPKPQRGSQFFLGCARPRSSDKHSPVYAAMRLLCFARDPAKEMRKSGGRMTHTCGRTGTQPTSFHPF